MNPEGKQSLLVHCRVVHAGAFQISRIQVASDTAVAYAKDYGQDMGIAEVLLLRSRASSFK